jgi:hypothetical protein
MVISGGKWSAITVRYMALISLIWVSYEKVFGFQFAIFGKICRAALLWHEFPRLDKRLSTPGSN